MTWRRAFWLKILSWVKWSSCDFEQHGLPLKVESSLETLDTAWGHHDSLMREVHQSSI